MQKKTKYFFLGSMKHLKATAARWQEKRESKQRRQRLTPGNKTAQGNKKIQKRKKKGIVGKKGAHPNIQDMNTRSG
jgi:hypothetical protein